MATTVRTAPEPGPQPSATLRIALLKLPIGAGVTAALALEATPNATAALKELSSSSWNCLPILRPLAKIRRTRAVRREASIRDRKINRAHNRPTTATGGENTRGAMGEQGTAKDERV
jgi:hypothetical protein